MRVTFPQWPVWNFHFPELDVTSIWAVNFIDKQNKPGTLADDKYRLAIGRNGVSSLVLLDKHELPALATRPDAVSVEYEP